MDRPLRTTLEELVEARTTRRDIVKGIFAAGGAMSAIWCLPNPAMARLGEVAEVPQAAGNEGLSELIPLPHVHNSDDPAVVKTIDVAEGYRTQVVIKRGDPVIAGVRPMEPEKIAAADQEKQFGYNNDFVAWLPLEKGSANSSRGLLCVNHEFTNPELMFRGVKIPRQNGDPN